jgi:hypothetical protein
MLTRCAISGATNKQFCRGAWMAVISLAFDIGRSLALYRRICWQSGGHSVRVLGGAFVSWLMDVMTAPHSSSIIF